jgi:UPF0755 protein
MHSPPPCCCNMRWPSQADRHGMARLLASRTPASMAARRAAVRLPALALAAAAAIAAACGGEPHGVPEHVVIPMGASFRAAAESLGRAGIVEWPRAFRVYASVTHRDRVLKAGTYLLQRGISWSQALDALTGGKGLVHTITIPEGWSLADMVPALSHALLVPPESIEAAARDTALLSRVGATSGTLEGFLFPDTYAFPDGTTARTAIGEMVHEFEREWKPQWDGERAALGMSRNEVVTLASIIEKEARLSEERPVISAVYHNRLRLGMPLQADPTIQYALGHHVGRVTFKDLDVVSPYNTYRHPGLPPGPIGSPGTASLDAAVTPAAVPYLYFVAAPDGHHEFRTTFAEHTEARQELRHNKPPKHKPAPPPS